MFRKGELIGGKVFFFYFSRENDDTFFFSSVIFEHFCIFKKLALFYALRAHMEPIPFFF